MKRELPTCPSLSSAVPRNGLPLRLAGWLLDSPGLGQASSIKRLAGNLLKQPARRGVVEAQSRLGLLLCRDCGNARDRRIGQSLLQQAARAGDQRALEALEVAENSPLSE